MASTFKTIGANDVISSRTLLHEAIPITGTIVSGTYADVNIKNYSHGMFQTVYDYPYLSSSANHIFDITAGLSVASPIYSSVTSQKSKKNNVYNQMAQMLVGYDITGSILRFDADGDFLAGGTKIDDAVFVSFSRLLVKDEIKKESFQMVLAVDDAYPDAHQKQTIVTDRGAATEYRVNSPAGEFAILYATGNLKAIDSYEPCGLIYYQAGIAVLTSSLFQSDENASLGLIDTSPAGNVYVRWANDKSFTGSMISEEISASADHLRHRIVSLQFNNTTELNSTIYFCRANHNEFNYSSNPTYLSASQIRVKNASTDTPVSYITTVGLYSADNQLLAVGKLSEPLRKDPTIEYTLRARLDY